MATNENCRCRKRMTKWHNMSKKYTDKNTANDKQPAVIANNTGKPQ